MKAVEYAHLVIRSGHLKHRVTLETREQAELDQIRHLLLQYEDENPEKARQALELIIEDRKRARRLTH